MHTLLQKPVRVVAAAAFALSLSPSVGAAADMPSFNLVMRDGALAPATLEVPANTKFRLALANQGTTPAEFESKELGKEKVLAPGASSFLIFQPLKPGSYKFFDEFHPSAAPGAIVAK